MLNGIRFVSNAQKTTVGSPATSGGTAALRPLVISTIDTCSVSHACNADMVPENTYAERS
jgi:hypothetical protein